jgi:hypothetical protein
MDEGQESFLSKPTPNSTSGVVEIRYDSILLVYSRRYPKYSRLTLLLCPSLSCSGTLKREETDRLRALSLPRLRLISGASIAISGGGAGSYFHLTSALHIQERADPPSSG